MRRFARTLPICALLLLCASCSESDIVGIRIQLSSDLSGTISISSLQTPREGGPLESSSAGVDWQDRVSLVLASGSFPKLSALRIAEISFQGGTTPEGINYVLVTLPRGPNVRWAKALSSLSPEDRKKAAAIFDPQGKLRAIGSVVKLRIDLPGQVVAHGLSPLPRGCEEAADKDRAELLVPVEVALKSGDAMKWHLTWQK